MKLQTYLRFLLICMLQLTVCYASESHLDPFEVRFIQNNKWKPNEQVQKQFRESTQWKNFINKNGEWWVQFNETNHRPHRAFGNPIAIQNANTPQSAAYSFLYNYAGEYLNNAIELKALAATPSSNKYYQPNFIQMYNGLEVLWSRATVKITKDYKVVMYGLDVYDNINLSTTPELNLQSAIQYATKDFNFTNKIEIINNGLSILPIPSFDYNRNEYKLVYQFNVKFMSNEGEPANYYTLVDANSGKILYRENRVEHFNNGGTSIQVQGTLYPTHPYNPSAITNLPYIKVIDPNGVNFTDINGNISYATVVPFSATLELQGPWAMVYEGVSGNVVSSITSTINPGSNTILFDPNSNIQQLTGYYHTNIIHDFMKSKLPTFTALDFPMIVRVNRNDGTCNAFYDGNINFYTTAGGCNALSEVADVVYHEYGHGITNLYWNANGLNFSNGGMGEGYSDVWAICITNNPTLGIGYSTSSNTTSVRDYDFANGVPRKIYPQNIVGEVHGDGEIIAGAWWSTALNMGSTSAMADLFTASHAGLANGPDGSEGQVYTDILIDALMEDDNDANLSNGTPNSSAIVPAFAAHGITLLSNANLTHTPITTALGNTNIIINASLSNVQFAWALQGLKGAYKINNGTTWTPLLFTNTTGTNYTATIPAQPNGTIVGYYIGIEDVNGALSNVKPAGANATDPNLPYFIMIGFNKIFTEDFDFNGSIWTEGLPTDNATTGIWEQTIPEQTLVSGTIVQPSSQVTPGGVICYVTGGMQNGSVGGNDVDGGRTTLESPLFSLAGYTNPTFDYYRWYTNDQGATPGTDNWQVEISDDGITYIPLENTKVADHSWRQNAFRVFDYIPNATQISFRFIAEDANAGSLIEALMDDLSLYDQLASGIESVQPIVTLAAFPNPSNQFVNLAILMAKSEKVNLTVCNSLGEIVGNYNYQLNSGSQQIELPTKHLSNGFYFINLQTNNQIKSIKFSVNH